MTIFLLSAVGIFHSSERYTVLFTLRGIVIHETLSPEAKLVNRALNCIQMRVRMI